MSMPTPLEHVIPMRVLGEDEAEARRLASLLWSLSMADMDGLCAWQGRVLKGGHYAAGAEELVYSPLQSLPPRRGRVSKKEKTNILKSADFFRCSCRTEGGGGWSSGL